MLAHKEYRLVWSIHAHHLRKSWCVDSGKCVSATTPDALQLDIHGEDSFLYRRASQCISLMSWSRRLASDPDNGQPRAHLQ